MSLASDYDITPTIQVDGTDMFPEQLLSLRIERGVRLVGRITMRMLDGGFEHALSSKFALGSEIKVKAYGGGLLMVGKVTSTQMVMRGPAESELIVTADDAAVALTRGSTVTTYADMTFSDVVSKVAQRAGMSVDTDASTTTFPYLIQSGSDLQFIDDLADRVGFDWWVGGSEGKKLFFKPPTTAEPVASYTVGENIHEISVRASGLHPTEVSVTGWSPTTQTAVASSAALVKAGPGTPTLSSDSMKAHITSGSALRPAAATTVRPGATSTAEANELAEAYSAHAAAGSITARVQVDGSALVEPGSYVEINAFGPSSGTYRVTHVEHTYANGGFITRFTAGDRRPTGLVDLLGPRPTSAFAHQGLVTGTVTNNSDDKGYGRIQVLINGLTASDTSAWARIATHGAGAERGFVVLPEVGDEVLVGFEEGDTRRPVILGGLFGDKGKMADYGIGNDKTVGRGLVSRLGYRMEISDGTEPATQHVRLSLEKGDAHMLRVGKDKVEVTVPAGVPVEIKSGGTASFIIDDKGNVTIKGAKVTIEAQEGLVLKSSTEVAVTASTDLKLDGLKFALKGSAQGEVNGGGTLAVKGGMVQIN